MKLSTIILSMCLIHATASAKKKDKKFCKSSRWLQETVDGAREDETDCKVQNSRIFGICGLILGDLFRFKSEKAAFVSTELPEQRYASYSIRDQKSIHQYMETKIDHLLIMHDYLRCGEVREHMENYYPQLFLVHAYTLSDLSIKGNILPFVDFGLNKVVKDEENLDEDEQDDLDMYVNVPVDIHNKVTDIFLSFRGKYAQEVRYSRSTDTESRHERPKTPEQTTQERTLAKMFDLISRITDTKNEIVDTKQEIEDMVKQNSATMAVQKDDMIKKIAGKMDSISRRQQYDLEDLINNMDAPRIGSQTILITIITIQLVAIIALIYIIKKKNDNYINTIQQC